MSKCMSADGIEIKEGMKVLEKQFVGELEDWDDTNAKVISVVQTMDDQWLATFYEEGEATSRFADELFASRDGVIQYLIDATESEIEQLEGDMEFARDTLKRLCPIKPFCP